jgi:hypothetical protein
MHEWQLPLQPEFGNWLSARVGQDGKLAVTVITAPQPAGARSRRPGPSMTITDVKSERTLTMALIWSTWSMDREVESVSRSAG